MGYRGYPPVGWHVIGFAAKVAEEWTDRDYYLCGLLIDLRHGLHRGLPQVVAVTYPGDELIRKAWQACTCCHEQSRVQLGDTGVWACTRCDAASWVLHNRMQRGL